MHLTDVVTGEQITIPRRQTTFLLYYNFASPQNLQDVSYAAYLARTFHPNDVDFIVVTGGHIPDFENMRRAGVLSFPLVVDSSFAVARHLTIPKDSDRSFVIGQDGRLLFAPPREAFAPEDIRELLERYTQGHITYGMAPPATATLVRSSFPNIRVKELHTGNINFLFSVAQPGRADYLFFTASCPACMLDSTLGRLRPDIEAGRMTAIITSRVPEVELTHFIADYSISKPIYLAEDEVPGFESVYFDSGAREAAVLRIKTDPKGLITNIEPIQ